MSDEITPSIWDSGILCDTQIAYLSQQTNNPMITPFFPKQMKDNHVISYGLSSYGYDVRISDEFKIISKEYVLNPGIRAETNTDKAGIIYYVGLQVIDPTEFNKNIFEDYKSSDIFIPPHGFVLGKTMEIVNIPKDIMVIALAKSTWARCGLVVGVTPLEPGFEGTVTIELSNTTDLPIRVKAGHGICQFLFLKGSKPCEVSYADRGGKYMHQRDVTLPKTIS